MIHSKDNPKAILLILLGMTVFAVQDTLIKLLSDNTNIYLIYFIRSFVGLFIIFCYLKFNKIPIIITTHYPLLTFIRSTIFFFGFSLYYYSLTKLSMAMAITLFFVSPFFVTIFSVFIIKEQVGIRRWLAILIGFIGVFLVMDPKFKNFNIYSLFPIICALCYALTVIIQKKTSDKDSLFSQIIHIYISAIFFSIIIKSSLLNVNFDQDIINEYKFLLIEWGVPNYINLIMSVAVGLTGVAGFFCMFGAYNIGSPATIAPFEYVMILYGIIISWLIWDETLNLKAYIGLLFIVIAGVYTFFRENNLNKEITVDSPLR